jgi:predicted Zn-dependent peptidase
MDLMWKQSLVLTLALGFAFGCSSASKKGSGENSSGSSESAEMEKLGLRFPLRTHELANGLRVLIVEDATVPLIAYQTWVNAGSVDETFGLTGMAHLFEHLMFKDSEKFGPRAFFNRLEARGANVNAFTTRDYTVFHETFIPNLLDQVIALEADRLGNLKIDAETLFTERQVVFEERRLRTDNSPDGRMQEAVWQLAFHSHPYRWPVIGYEEDLKRMEVRDLQGFFDKYYHPANVTLVIVGDVKADEVIAKIEKAYGAIPGKARPKRTIAREPEQTAPRKTEIRDQVATQKVTLAYPSTSALEEDTYALDVISNILFAGSSSRAHRRIVEEKEIALAVGGVNYTPLYRGLFLANATMKGRHRGEEFVAEIEALIRDIQAQGVTPEEIQTAVRQLTVQTVDSVRTAHGLANLIGTVDAIFGDPMRFKEDLAKYTRVKNDDIIRVARQYLIPNRKNVVTLIPGARGVSP